MFEIKDLTVKFGNNLILENINFSIEGQNYLSVIGPNGSGKSTFLKTVLGLIKPRSGEIFFNEFLSDGIGYVPQIKTLDRNFPAKVKELVASGINKSWPKLLSRKDKELVKKALEFTGAVKLYDKSIEHLSGGELQRVYLARSIINQPRLLLLDEPATGIDLVCEKDISRNILDYRDINKALVIIVTHDLTAAYEHTDYSLFINRHQVFFGKSKEAFTDKNLQATFSHFGHSHGYKLGMVKNA